MIFLQSLVWSLPMLLVVVPPIVLGVIGLVRHEMPIGRGRIITSPDLNRHALAFVAIPVVTFLVCFALILLLQKLELGWNLTLLISAVPCMLVMTKLLASVLKSVWLCSIERTN